MVADPAVGRNAIAAGGVTKRTSAAVVGDRGEGEGRDPALRLGPERDCDESEVEERVTPTEAKGGGFASPCVSRQCERVLPLVNRLEPEPSPALVAGGAGGDVVGETSTTGPRERSVRAFDRPAGGSMEETPDGVASPSGNAVT